MVVAYLVIVKVVWLEVYVQVGCVYLTDFAQRRRVGVIVASLDAAFHPSYIKPKVVIAQEP